MPAYFIGAVQSVKDPAGLAEYQKLAGATLKKYGGRLIAGGTEIEVADGSWSPIGVVVVEFESLECAKQWYNSPEYSAVKPRRLQSADTGAIFLNAG